MKVYVLHHEREVDGHDEAKLVGVYATEIEAAEAKERALHRPGFAETPEGFSIDAYEIGRDQWVDGFVAARWSEREDDQDRAA